MVRMPRASRSRTLTTARMPPPSRPSPPSESGRTLLPRRLIPEVADMKLPAAQWEQQEEERAQNQSPAQER